MTSHHLSDRRALVLYGSETGNAQDVAEELGRVAQRLHFDTRVVEFNTINLRQLLQYAVVLISVSTTGQGDLPANAQSFWTTLRSTRLRPGCLQQMKFASFGLGDTSYPKFNWAHRKLYNRLIQLGAKPICDRGESDEQLPEGVDGTLLPWISKLRQRLLEEFPMPEGLQAIPDDVLLDPEWCLGLADPTSDIPRDNTSTILSSTVDNEVLAQPPKGLVPTKYSLPARIRSNARVTAPSHWQDVRHLALDLPDFQAYAPGDVLTLYPKNFPSDVNEFLRVTHWEPIADTPVKFFPSAKASATSTPPIPGLSPDSVLTVRTLLTNYLDIMSIPRRSFFAQLAHFTEDEFQRERLLEFTNPIYIDELYDYTTRPRRSILEVLQEFETVKIPWQRLCSIIPILRGRQFSIASAQAPNAGAESQTTIELLIAIVKYRTVIKRIRQGVCTRYVSSLREGQYIDVTLQKGGLGVTKAEIERPVVMIGPGTGVAPMRALIYQRNYWRSERQEVAATGARDMLFFGCRNAEADYFFKEEWEELLKGGVPLEVFAAFSRDQRQKIYVQDLLRQQGAKIYNALARNCGLIYVCGSSGKMPQAVREALIEGFQSHGQLSRDEAEAYLKGMEKSGRYKQETW